MANAPQDAIAKLEEAFELADMQAIRKQLQTLEKQHPADVAVQVARARLSAADGDVGAAQKKLETLVKAHPDSGLPLAWLGAVFVGQKKYNEGRPLLEKAITLGAEPPAALHALGVALGAAGHYEQALPYLGRAAEKMPSSAPTFFYLGVCFGQLHQWEDAEDALARAVELEPTYVDAFEALARVEVELKKPDAAVQIVEEGLRHNEGDRGLLRLRVQIKADHGDHDGALQALADAPESSRDVDDWNNLALLLMEKARWQEALDAAKGAVKADAMSSRAHYMLGLALENQPNADKNTTVAALKKAVELGDAKGEAGTRLGFILSAEPNANLAEAVQVLEATRKRNQDAPGTLLNLALAYARLDKKAEARALAETLAQNPNASDNVQDQARRLLTQL